MNYISEVSAVGRDATPRPAKITERVFDLGEFLRLLGRRKVPIIAFVIACSVIVGAELPDCPAGCSGPNRVQVSCPP